jgi:hypothetical protein
MAKRIKIFIVILSDTSIAVVADVSIGWAPAYEFLIEEWQMPDPANGNS